MQAHFLDHTFPTCTTVYLSHPSFFSLRTIWNWRWSKKFKKESSHPYYSSQSVTFSFFKFKVVMNEWLQHILFCRHWSFIMISPFNAWCWFRRGHIWRSESKSPNRHRRSFGWRIGKQRQRKCCRSVLCLMVTSINHVILKQNFEQIWDFCPCLSLH